MDVTKFYYNVHSDYQNIAESTALCILVACTRRHSISVIHDVLARLTCLTGICILCTLKLFYIDVHILSTL